GVALDHGVLQFDGAADRIDYAAEFDDAAVAGALDDPAVIDGDRRFDQIAAKGSKPGEDAIFVCAGEPAVADDVGHQNRRKFPGLGHCTALRYSRVAWRERQITRNFAG